MSSSVLRRLFGMSLCLVAWLAFAAPASATHNRATQISWTKGAGQGEIHFTVHFVARRSYYFPEPNVGEQIEDPVLEFGDGSSTLPSLTVSEVDGDTIYTQGQVVHTYSGNGPFTASMGSCCRLSASSGHVNNGDLYYRVHTLVDPVRASSSPSIAVAPIVHCPTSGTCSFAFAGSSADAGNHLRWRLASAAESGDSFFVQPGPPFAPQAATIDPVLGRITWDTTGAIVNSGGLPTYYSTQVIAEEVNSSGDTVSDAAADFFIALDDGQAEQPECEDVDGNGSIDNDNDGLCDNWEESGIDSDHDGQIDFFLPTGADPNHRDLFVEVDYMRGREPQRPALEDVATAYAHHGIALHFLIDDEVPFSKLLVFGSGCVFCQPDTADFDTIKDDYFGTVGNRSSANADALLEAREFVYHYALYANDQLDEEGSSGVAELPGNDFTVTLGNSSWRTGLFNGGPPTRRNESGTFMHELGHNLALQHGGGDSVNCKPNYLSVMNYTRQTTGFITAQLDYSDAVLPTLNENGLNEFLGIQGPSGAQVVYGPGHRRISNSTGPIDWDGAGGLQSGAFADINQIDRQGGCKSSSPGESLIGFDDWENLALAFQATPDFADGVHSTVFSQEPEIAAAEFEGEDADGDGVPNVRDNCPDVPGPVANAGCPEQRQPPAPVTTTSPPPAAAASRPGAPDTRLRRARIGQRKRVARFTFASSGGAAGVHFECRLDRKPYRRCTSPKVYANLRAGSHVFRVRAVDSLGQADPAPVSKRFAIE